MTVAHAPSLEELSRDVQRVRDSVTDVELARIVQRLAGIGLSVRKIAALIDRPKSTVGRVLKNAPSANAEIWDALPISVAYDVFYEAGTALLATYNRHLQEATSPVDEALWRDRIHALRTARSAVDADDRATMMELSERWTAERDRLRSA